MTNELLTTRIAKDQMQDLRRAAARRSWSRNAVTGGTAARRQPDLRSRLRVWSSALSWAHRSVGTLRPAGDDA